VRGLSPRATDGCGWGSDRCECWGWKESIEGSRSGCGSGCDSGCRVVWKSLDDESVRFRDNGGGLVPGGDVESEGPGLCSRSPAPPYGWRRSPVEMEFSSVFSRSASSLMYLDGPVARERQRHILRLLVDKNTAKNTAKHMLSLTYPLLGPRFMGTRLNEHFEPTRLQLEHCSTPDSDDASQRICPNTATSHNQPSKTLVRVYPLTNLFPPTLVARPRHLRPFPRRRRVSAHAL
jgi:hypothetical protein